MDTQELRRLQAPWKDRYRQDPAAARITMHARARLDGEAPSCSVETGVGVVRAGLHPAAGGDGTERCSGDMLLESLVACAGVTLRAVATSMAIPIRGGSVTAEGDADFRGTLGVSREAPVGMTAIRLSFELDTDATDEQLAKLIELTERYCVVLQTLRQGPAVSASVRRVTAL